MTTSGRRYDGVAVIVPCKDEALTIGAVISSFREALPGAAVVVLDSASSDHTARVAQESGALVIHEQRPGKGLAVRRLMADVEADVYVLVDGDATYDASIAPAMVEAVVTAGCDLVVARRVPAAGAADAYRRGHQLGNSVLGWIFHRLFHLGVTDILSGYRTMSRRFVKSFPAHSEGFEIETELNAHAAVTGVPVAELPSAYSSRPPGSHSKLSTFSDGWRILRRNLRLFRDARPLLSFALLSVPWLLVAAALGGIAVTEYLTTGNVLRFPSLIVGVGAFMVALNLMTVGFILERVTRNRNEAIRLTYLSYSGPLTQGVGADRAGVAPPPTRH